MARLTQAQMDALRAPTSGSGWEGIGYTYDPATNTTIQALPGGGYAQARYQPYSSDRTGEKWSMFNDKGDFDSEQALMNGADAREALMMAALAMGGIGALGSAAGVPLGFGGATGGTLGTNGAFLGEGVSSGVPMWDGALSAAQAGTAGTAAAAGLETLPNLSPMEMPAGMGAEPFVPSSAMSNAFAGLPAAATAAGAKGAMDGLSKYLGPAATALGAISGAQDQPGQTSTRDLPEWLKPYVTGMLDKTRGLLDQQMPIAQQQATGLLSKGNSLMNINPAGNGFGLFTKGRY